ncbi:histidine decarboxylase [Latimeria chalumnae]|uniref:histidine decarboxylase n=1 Tax=Latimeria chalumnae TaxID=7897 RepID=UPI0003C122CE|nr:PREDICTED: histidine decarboxylase [Latimeria chalumnae]|eukprot:XP_005989691.1 PREDICTED: histidine decarboxylase [Latimeria chalumnae]
MESEDYRRRGKELVDYIAKYLTSVKERRVTPDVQPGYMRALLPDRAPTEPENWDNIFGDIEKVIMPGVVHWQSPHMHAYFPALTSWPSLLGDMLADAINCLGFTWASSPACTELEMNVMDWLAKMLGLPDHFLHHHPESRGGGVLQSTVSESTLISLLAARKAKIMEMKQSEPDADESVLNARLIAYASNQAHSSVEKAGLISLVKMRFLPPDENFSLRGETLKKAIDEDRKQGLVPIFLCATLGTTGVCAFDNLAELGPVCARAGVWLHIDAAYAGTAFLCPEFRQFLNGVEYADSFAFNPSKWMMVHFDCTAFWIKDQCKLQQTFSVDPVYLRHANSGTAIDFMHWQIPLSRRFRSLKLWFVIRSFGVKNLQAHVRHGIEMAKYFESLVRSDPNFEIPAKRHLGLVVFRLKGPNSLTEEFLKEIMKTGSMFLIPATVSDKFIIRFTVTSQFTTKEDILRDWNIIQQTAGRLLNQHFSLQSITIDGGTKMTYKNKGENNIDGIVSYKAALEAEDKGASKMIMDHSESKVSNLCLINSSTEDLTDPFDDSFPEESQVVTKNKPFSFIYSYLAVKEKHKVARSLSCNSVPVNEQRGLIYQKLMLKDDTTKNGSSNKNIFSKLPEKMIILEKSAFKKLTKFYSVPSFSECSLQCGIQLPCYPLQTIKS